MNVRPLKSTSHYLVEALIAITLLGTHFNVRAQSRTWTGQNGVAIEAELVAVSDDGQSVALRATDGQIKQSALLNLSETDRAFVETYQKQKREMGLVSFRGKWVTKDQKTILADKERQEYEAQKRKAEEEAAKYRCSGCNGTGKVYESNIGGVWVPFPEPRRDLGFQGPTPCEDCGGTGKNENPCPRCGGEGYIRTGEVMIDGDLGQAIELCPQCDGSGRTSSVVGNATRGRNSVATGSTASSRTTCGTCKGSGKCSYCGGTGITKGKKPHELGASCLKCFRSPYARYRCSTCNGSGYTHSRSAGTGERRNN